MNNESAKVLIGFMDMLKARDEKIKFLELSLSKEREFSRQITRDKEELDKQLVTVIAEYEASRRKKTP